MIKVRRRPRPFIRDSWFVLVLLSAVKLPGLRPLPLLVSREDETEIGIISEECPSSSHDLEGQGDGRIWYSFLFNCGRGGVAASCMLREGVNVCRKRLIMN